MLDYHVHSNISFDSKEPPANMLTAAVNAGITEICFTDHVDYIPKKPENPVVFDKETYLLEYSKLIEQAKILGVTVRLGAEIGSAIDNPAFFSSFAKSIPFDFIICSVHFVDGEDPFFESYYQKRTAFEAYSDYLKEALLAVKTHTAFNVLGHLTYPGKYYMRKDLKFCYKDHRDITEEIFKNLIHAGKGIEINTSGIKNTGVPMPDVKTVKRFVDMGGEIITIGSDAHKKEDVGAHIKTTLMELQEAGVKYICGFQAQKPIFHSIQQLIKGTKTKTRPSND